METKEATMLTFEDIQAKTGVTTNTIQYWRRRQNEGLLPEPIAVRKKVIYFDDSIIERIQFIKDRLEEGVKLPEIKKLIEKKQIAEYHANYPGYNDDYGVILEEIADLVKKWESGDCKNEVCMALALDPAISGNPEIRVSRPDVPLQVDASIISNGWVHFSELRVSGNCDIEVVHQAKIKVSDYGLLMALIVEPFANHNMFITAREIPSLLFDDSNLYRQLGDFGLNTLEEAKKLTRVLRAGQEFIKHL
jgi:DNA-binding transcriptional MerR regulator